MNRKSLLAVVLIGVLCVLASAVQPALNEGADNEFAGKILEVKTTAKQKFLLKDVQVIQLCGQSFLAGTGIKIKVKGDELPKLHKWWEGLAVRVNLSKVVSYCPMTLKQYKEQYMGDLAKFGIEVLDPE